MHFLKPLWVAALIACLAPLACVDAARPEPARANHAARAFVGVWIGGVSWNAPIVRYVWLIHPDGMFSSARFGRSSGGGGVWRADGRHLTMTYAGGVRYEGDVAGNGYSGSAVLPDGRSLGSFSMARESADDRDRQD